jgi:hypothetical protein
MAVPPLLLGAVHVTVAVLPVTVAVVVRGASGTPTARYTTLLADDQPLSPTAFRAETVKE